MSTGPPEPPRLMDARVALVRSPSSRMAEGIVTYGERAPIDAYVAAIAAAGWEIRDVPHADDLPDSALRMSGAPS